MSGNACYAHDLYHDCPDSYWCTKHKMNHFNGHECGRMDANATMLNGHQAGACPHRIDISLLSDGPRKRWAHGGCMPKKTDIKISQDGDTITWTAGNTRFTMTGSVLHSTTMKGGFDPRDSELTLVMRGALKQEVVHCEPHFDVTESGKHKFCDCTCLQCQSSMNKTCICRECDCGGKDRGAA